MVACRAGPIANGVFEDIVPGAPNKNSAAAGTIRVRRFAVDIALVDVMQPRIESNSPRGVERFRRRPGLVLQLEVGMKRGEMQWNIRAEMFEHPFGKPPNFARIIVQRGDDEIGDFEPDVRLLLEPSPACRARAADASASRARRIPP